MAHKAEISWKRTDAEGETIQVYAHRTGGEWYFYWRYRRFDLWQPMPKPPLEDWMELLDAIRRRVARMLLPPDQEKKVVNTIRERFPEAEIPPNIL